MTDMKSMLREQGSLANTGAVIIGAGGNDARNINVDTWKWEQIEEHIADVEYDLSGLIRAIDRAGGAKVGVVLPHPTVNMDKAIYKKFKRRLTHIAEFHGVTPIDITGGMAPEDFIQECLYDGVHFHNRRFPEILQRVTSKMGLSEYTPNTELLTSEDLAQGGCHLCGQHHEEGGRCGPT